MKRKYSDLADSLAAGGWAHNCPDANSVSSESVQTAALIDIMISLRAIRNCLSNIASCPNLRGCLKSVQKLEALAREFWVKPTRRKGAKK